MPENSAAERLRTHAAQTAQTGLPCNIRFLHRTPGIAVCSCGHLVAHHIPGPGVAVVCRVCTSTTILPSAIIVDIDGTLADVVPARYLVRGDRFDLAAFHEYGTGPAEPIQETVTLVSAFRAAGVKVILLTGRAAEWEPATRAWLGKHPIPFDELWHMPQGFSGGDREGKELIYREHIAPRYRVVLAMDDRPRIIQLWESLGLRVHVVPGWTDADGD